MDIIRKIIREELDILFTPDASGGEIKKEIDALEYYVKELKMQYLAAINDQEKLRVKNEYKEVRAKLYRLKTHLRDNLGEEFNIINNTLTLGVPYDGVKKVNVGGRDVYVLFGDIDYFPNKQAILALKRKSGDIGLDYDSYKDFLGEFKKRFYSIQSLKDSELLVSVETTCPITDEVSKVLELPYVKDGFKKRNPGFKMRDLNDFSDREKIVDLFDLNFSLGDESGICVIDDFITSGSTFRNAFSMLPPELNVVGVCLFQLKS